MDDDGIKAMQTAASSAWELPPRLHEVLKLIARGRTDEDIADELKISLNTVKAHKKTIYRALGARNGPHAVHRGHEWGLLGVAAHSPGSADPAVIFTLVEKLTESSRAVVFTLVEQLTKLNREVVLGHFASDPPVTTPSPTDDASATDC